MEAKMQMLDTYVTKYSFDVKEKFYSNKGLGIEGKVNYKELNREVKNNKIYVDLELQNEIILRDTNTEFGNINIVIVGKFVFDKNINEEEMNKLLSINGPAILYQQVRSYINANTALSNSIPNIIIPIINFAAQNTDDTNTN